MRRLTVQLQLEPRHATVLPVESYFETLSRVILKLPYLGIHQIISSLMQAFENDRTVFVFGNGGSAATASHFASDLSKGATEHTQGKRLKVRALTDNVSLLTAWANDVSYDHVFCEQLKNFVQPGDVAFAISASGNSPNVLEALKTARVAGATTVGIAGYQGGRMKALCDACVVVPSDNMQMIEDLHHAIAHSIFTAVRERMESQE
jgi:D-sedoheptulose 7-phosphate isomerase